MHDILLNEHFWRIVMAQGLPAALLTALWLWIMLRGAPQGFALIERIYSRQAELLERHSVLIAAQHEELRKLALLAQQQTAVLQSMDSGLSALLGEQRRKSFQAAPELSSALVQTERGGRRARGRA